VENGGAGEPGVITDEREGRLTRGERTVDELMGCAINPPRQIPWSRGPWDSKESYVPPFHEHAPDFQGTGSERNSSWWSRPTVFNTCHPLEKHYSPDGDLAKDRARWVAMEKMAV